MSKPGLLFVGPPLPSVRAALEERFAAYDLPADPQGQEHLFGERGDRIRAIANGAGVKVPSSLMGRLPALEIVANFGVGYDSVDAAWAGRHGIVVTNTPDVLTEEVADLAIALLLATLREVPQADRYLRAGGWRERPYPLSRGTLRGRKVGILGLGRIGTAIAARLVPFGVEIAYCTRRPRPEVPFRYFDSLLAMAEAVDTLIVIAPATAETRNIVDAAVLRALGPEGVVVNVARGSLIDEAALAAALRDGTILGAGLDVFVGEPNVSAELIAQDNTVLLPHIGSASAHTRRLMGDVVVANLIAWADGQPPVTPVPETPWPEVRARGG